MQRTSAFVLPEHSDKLGWCDARVITRMLEDGTWDRLYSQYFGAIEGMPRAAEARANLTGR
jgi:hypothetical protein